MARRNNRWLFIFLPVCSVVLAAGPRVWAEPTGYYRDPATGVVYRKVERTVAIPVVETAKKTEQKMVSVPRTVTETRPRIHSVVRPVARQTWQPQVQGRWNPFRQPAVVYRSVPETVWEIQNTVVQESNTRVDWVAEQRTVEVPASTVRYRYQTQVAYEPVTGVANMASAGRLQPTPSIPPVAEHSERGGDRRLLPMTSAELGSLVSLDSPRPDRFGPRASGTSGKRGFPRSSSQAGLPASNLARQVGRPSSGGLTPFPSVGSPVMHGTTPPVIATAPASPVFR